MRRAYSTPLSPSCAHTCTGARARERKRAGHSHLRLRTSSRPSALPPLSPSCSRAHETGRRGGRARSARAQSCATPRSHMRKKAAGGGTFCTEKVRSRRPSPAHPLSAHSQPRGARGVRCALWKQIPLGPHRSRFPCGSTHHAPPPSARRQASGARAERGRQPAGGEGAWRRDGQGGGWIGSHEAIGEEDGEGLVPLQVVPSARRPPAARGRCRVGYPLHLRGKTTLCLLHF